MYTYIYKNIHTYVHAYVGDYIVSMRVLIYMHIQTPGISVKSLSPSLKWFLSSSLARSLSLSRKSRIIYPKLFLNVSSENLWSSNFTCLVILLGRSQSERGSTLMPRVSGYIQINIYIYIYIQINIYIYILLHKCINLLSIKFIKHYSLMHKFIKH